MARRATLRATLGQVARYSPEVFVTASIFTLVAFAGLTLFVLVTRCDFSFLYGIFCLGAIVLVTATVLSHFSHHHSSLYGYIGFGVVSFGCWIMYDTTQIIQRADDDLTPGIAALELIIDIVLFQGWIRDYLENRNSSDDP